MALVSVNRPERFNALNMAAKRLLQIRFDVASADPAVRVVVLTGVGAAFAAGTDIAEMRDMTPGTHAEPETNAVFLAQRACAKPLIAAVEGYSRRCSPLPTKRKGCSPFSKSADRNTSAPDGFGYLSLMSTRTISPR